jgi:hypothetical protein
VIVLAELIKPFISPDFRIETVGKVCDEEDLERLNDALRTGRAEIVASNISGHDPYTHVLRYHYTDATTDFLVQIDTSDYLVQYS